jgi:hypothetical protein
MRSWRRASLAEADRRQPTCWRAFLGEPHRGARRSARRVERFGENPGPVAVLRHELWEPACRLPAAAESAESQTRGRHQTVWRPDASTALDRSRRAGTRSRRSMEYGPMTTSSCLKPSEFNGLCSSRTGTAGVFPQLLGGRQLPDTPARGYDLQPGRCRCAGHGPLWWVGQGRATGR